LTLAVMGRVERVATARPTMDRPFCRFSCKTWTFNSVLPGQARRVGAA
jgi:hypothetical protein